MDQNQVVKDGAPVAVVCGVFRTGTTWVGDILGRLRNVACLQEPFNLPGLEKGRSNWDSFMRIGAVMAFERDLYGHWPGLHDPIEDPDQRELMERLHSGLLRQPDWSGVVKFMAVVYPEFWPLLGEDVRVVLVERAPRSWLACCIRSANWWPIEVACRLAGPWHKVAEDLGVMDRSHRSYPLLVAACFHRVMSQFYRAQVEEFCPLHTVVDYATLLSEWDVEVPRLAEFTGSPLPDEKTYHEWVQVPFRSWDKKRWTRSDMEHVLTLLEE